METRGPGQGGEGARSFSPAILRSGLFTLAELWCKRSWLQAGRWTKKQSLQWLLAHWCTKSDVFELSKLLQHERKEQV